VLDALIDRQQHQGAVSGAELEQKSVQARPFPGRQDLQQRFLLGQTLQLHVNSSKKSVAWAVSRIPTGNPAAAGILGG
jgi:hypothetical protein